MLKTIYDWLVLNISKNLNVDTYDVIIHKEHADGLCIMYIS